MGTGRVTGHDHFLRVVSLSGQARVLRQTRREPTMCPCRADQIAATVQHQHDSCAIPDAGAHSHSPRSGAETASTRVPGTTVLVHAIVQSATGRIRLTRAGFDNNSFMAAVMVNRATGLYVSVSAMAIDVRRNARAVAVIRRASLWRCGSPGLRCCPRRSSATSRRGPAVPPGTRPCSRCRRTAGPLPSRRQWRPPTSTA